MKYVKQSENGYIVSIGIDSYGEEITEAEYNEILAVISNKPMPMEGYDYRLKEDLTWEEYEVPVIPPSPDDEITADELVEMIRGEME